MPELTLRVCALYPDLMNIYADRGNLLLLQRRCEWRGIGFEGVIRNGVIGTYLHGPLLPKNAWFADWLVQRALGLDELAPLDDVLEDAAHAAARRAAGV